MKHTRLFRAPRNRMQAAPLLLAIITVLATTIIVLTAQPAARAQAIPTDAQGGCPVSAATFNTWFQSGTPTLNGVVNPANSVTFPGNPNCDFYKWSEQMFLWLTSPAPSIYGGGSRIFDSPTFYDVSPLDSSNHRTLTRHVSGRFPFIAVRVAKPGPHGLPLIRSKAGQLLEVEPPKIAPSGKQLILNSVGKEVEIERAQIQNGKPVFLDKAGKTIASPKPAIRALPLVAKIPAAHVSALQIGIVQKFIINGRPIFLNGLGQPVETEEGQAETGDVLESQNHSLVYYATMVNDVYAFFLTGTKTGGITPAPTQFPTTATDLAKVTAFASTHGVTFPDPNALAIEVKTAWVEASTVSNPANYITMSVTVPTYNTSSSTKWVANGQKTVTLALVSIHVVGSAKTHPEMIWASFEHFGNTPNAAYTYNSTSGPKNMPQNTSGTWLFCASGASGPLSSFNVPHMSTSGNDIVAASGQTISPSNTLRLMPFGMPGSSAGSNTEIISSNHSVLSLMPAGDVRNNYFMIGATWTPFGAIPTGGNGVGTNQLANSALETYAQGSNCFSCHVGNMLGSGPDSGLSHIYFPIQPLTF